jgi:putative tributyrin esterase
MAFLSCNIFSEVLEMDSEINVILPYGKGQKEKSGKFPVLYLLHGLSDDHTKWCRMTSLERYVRELNLAVVMPNVHRSFYLNLFDGRRYFDFVNIELPSMMENIFKISDKREDKFVAGLSMGGYGAMKMALSDPYQFSAAASFSGALDFEDVVINKNHDEKSDETLRRELKDENDLFYLIDHAGNNMPSIYQACGTEDFLYEENTKFRDYIKNKCTDFHYEEGPGTHEWGFWDMHLKKFINFLCERNSKISNF